MVFDFSVKVLQVGEDWKLLWGGRLLWYFCSVHLAERELQIAAQLGGPGWDGEVRAA